MKSKYYPPTYRKDEFHCPLCNVYAKQSWRKLWLSTGDDAKQTEFEASWCNHCYDLSFWYKGTLIIPKIAPVEFPHPDLPQPCLADYEEARNIFTDSPRSSAALLRLCVQKLMRELGERGKDLNDDIATLVSKGLPPLIQKSLDICRVVGNNAVHPGEINVEDTPEIVQDIFGLINLIVDDRITRPREIEAQYNKLPQSARDAIDKRDSTK